MTDAKEMEKSIEFMLRAHSENAAKPSKAFRKWDGKTPYGIHPIWCAMTLLHETALPEELRELGYQALLYHDIIEDTDSHLPENTSEKIRNLVEEMTFESSDAEMNEIWSKSKEITLLKLYDKVSNLLDGRWMSQEKHERYRAYTLKLANETEKSFAEFGNLNIIKIARALCSDP